VSFLSIIRSSDPSFTRKAGASFGPGLISEDLPEELPRVYRRLFEALERT
jgi:hypothetical protein